MADFGGAVTGTSAGESKEAKVGDGGNPGKAPGGRSSKARKELDTAQAEADRRAAALLGTAKQQDGCKLVLLTEAGSLGWEEDWSVAAEGAFSLEMDYSAHVDVQHLSVPRVLLPIELSAAMAVSVTGDALDPEIDGTGPLSIHGVTVAFTNDHFDYSYSYDRVPMSTLGDMPVSYTHLTLPTILLV